MSATLATRRRCPYCGETIELGDCPIVATSFTGVEFVAAQTFELEEVELPSATSPYRLLPKTGWPVVAEPPSGAVAEENNRRRSGASRIEQAFGAGAIDTSRVELPSLFEEDGVEREDLPARACPECEYPLPQSIDERPAAVIAVVGVNRVGKTHLIAASLTQALRKGGLDPIGCREISADGETGKRFLEDYFDPLFRRGELLGATSAEDENVRFRPLVFNITLDSVELPFSLIIHDIAGEVLGEPDKRARSATYLRAARGVIFVVDPRDIDSLRDQMPSWVLEQEELGWDQGALLSSCLRADGLLDRDERIPVAVAVAKADLLAAAAGERPEFLTPAPAGESAEQFTSRVRATSSEVVAFLERQGAHQILGPAREYERRFPGSGGAGVTFHAFSALGAAPSPEGTLNAKVEPLNAVDPLAAVLAQL